MKRVFSFALFCLSFVSLATTQAQNPVTALQFLSIDLWPDYDQANVLALLTGTLPPDTSLPATVTLPLPEGAQINAVARITADNTMIDDIEYEAGAEELTLTTPDLRFRVEYYFPYTATESQRAFTYTWLADLPVEQLEIRVQQPAAAGSLLVEPTAVEVAESPRDGLTYYTLPTQTVPAGQPYSVSVSYTMNTPQLTIERQGNTPNTAESSQPPTPSAPATNFDPNWPLVLAGLGVVLIVAVLTWQVATRRPVTARPRKPRPARPEKQRAVANYCHSCGQPAQKGDRFCRHCGTALKGS